MNYLVTGNRGFIGSHLSEMIEGYGYTTIGLDKLNEYPTVDALTDFIDRNRICGVFHLGARPFIPDCFGNNIDRVIESNVSFTGDLLMACKNSGVKRLVYMSTSEIYGNVKKLPINESTPVNPQSTYSASKFAAESLCRSFGAETGLDVIVLRQFNVYGPNDTHPRIIPKLMRAAKYDSPVLLGNLNVSRDFTFVSDASHALINLMFLDKTSIPAKYRKTEDLVMVHGSGEEITLRNLIDKISKLYDREIEVKTDDSFSRPRDVIKLRSDPKMYNSIFSNKKQKKISIDEGLGITKRWYDKNDWAWEKNE